jgi:antirestriction protein
MTDETATIKIYVACLAAYNNGILHGRWIDAMQGEDHIWESIKAMLAESPIPGAEEHAIHDHEGFEGLSISEYEGIENICALADFIAEHGELGARLLEHFGDTGEAREAIEDHYAGEYKSLADFAQEITEETTQIPQSLQYYIDWERMARDLAINDVLTIETSFECVHVFWRH